MPDSRVERSNAFLRILDKFPLLESADGYEAKRCSEYLSNERGIDKRAQNVFSLRYNPKNPREKIILFPRIDKENKIWWGGKGRQ
jgi:hypothetical protein